MIKRFFNTAFWVLVALTVFSFLFEGQYIVGGFGK
jgi:hypothetical protein